MTRRLSSVFVSKPLDHSADFGQVGVAMIRSGAFLRGFFMATVLGAPLVTSGCSLDASSDSEPVARDESSVGTAAWVAMARPDMTVYGVWGPSANDTWAVGARCEWSLGQCIQVIAVSRWQGDTWRAFPVPYEVGTLAGIWGSGASDVWAVGATADSRGIVVHWDGTAWTVADRSKTALVAVHGASATDVTAVGYQDALRHWDGARWTSVIPPRSGDPPLFAVWTRPGETWRAGAGRYVMRSGDAPLSWSVDDTIYALHGSSSSDVWAVGAKGVAYHYDGTSFTAHPVDVASNSYGERSNLYGVWASAPNDAWAVGDGGFFHWDGRRWSKIGVRDAGGPFSRIGGSSSSDLWVVGSGNWLRRSK